MLGAIGTRPIFQGDSVGTTTLVAGVCPAWCVGVTQLAKMARRANGRPSIWLLGLALVVIGNPLAAQDEDLHVYTDAPRLLLTKPRLRLLQRERERNSMRWQQFDALVAAGAPTPEAPLAQALYYRVAGTAAAGKKALDWALDAKADTVADLR